jgi:hypothetical protein
LESGARVLKKFEIADFEMLDETPLPKLFEGLRARLASPEGGPAEPRRSDAPVAGGMKSDGGLDNTILSLLIFPDAGLHL